MEYGI